MPIYIIWVYYIIYVFYIKYLFCIYYVIVLLILYCLYCTTYIVCVVCIVYIILLYYYLVLYCVILLYYIILLYYTVFALGEKLKNIGGVSPARKAKIPPRRILGICAGRVQIGGKARMPGLLWGSYGLYKARWLCESINYCPRPQKRL